MKKKHEEFEDDGHVIADMNVEGMPWYQEGVKPGDTDPATDLTRGETWAAVRGMMKAALLITGAFILGFLIFILILLYLWKN
ncbi:MAG: hypothetical protein IJW41_00125 [Oscillospiraceae bacterium]|nr:hypothetical protein [Oscillospiraceae bacterium]